MVTTNEAFIASLMSSLVIGYAALAILYIKTSNGMKAFLIGFITFIFAYIGMITNG